MTPTPFDPRPSSPGSHAPRASSSPPLSPRRRSAAAPARASPRRDRTHPNLRRRGAPSGRMCGNCAPRRLRRQSAPRPPPCAAWPGWSGGCHARGPRPRRAALLPLPLPPDRRSPPWPGRGVGADEGSVLVKPVPGLVSSLQQPPDGPGTWLTVLARGPSASGAKCRRYQARCDGVRPCRRPRQHRGGSGQRRDGRREGKRAGVLGRDAWSVMRHAPCPPRLLDFPAPRLQWVSPRSDGAARRQGRACQ